MEKVYVKYLSKDTIESIKNYQILVNYHLLMKNLPDVIKTMITSYENENDTEVITKIQTNPFLHSPIDKIHLLKHLDTSVLHSLLKTLPLLVSKTTQLHYISDSNKTEFVLALILLGYEPKYIRYVEGHLTAEFKYKITRSYAKYKIANNSGCNLLTNDLYPHNMRLCNSYQKQYLKQTFGY